MDQYDPQQPDAYALHLAQLSTPNGAVASRDIHNQEGVLLVKKGYTIKADTAQRLLSHKLVQPLETSVSIADAITGQQLFEDVLAMLRADKECQTIHQALNLNDALRQQCQLYASLPLIAQKATVFRARLHGEYNRALFCAWFAMALADQTGDKQLQSGAFIAGLVHDMGLLHINPSTVAKSSDHTEEECRALQSHSLIADTFLSYVVGLPRDVRRAVREHHEHNDGTGYPAGLFGEKLCALGRIVAMADSVWLASKNTAGRKVSTLAEVITLTKMNAVQHCSFILSALYSMQQRAGLNASAAMPAQRIENALDYLARSEEALRTQFNLVANLKTVLPKPSAHHTLRSVHVKIERLWLVVTSSGLLSDSLSQWLQQTTNSEDRSAALAIHDMSLMYKELQWQLAQLARTLTLTLSRDTELSDELRSAIAAVVESLHGQGEGWQEEASDLAERTSAGLINSGSH